MTLRSVTVLGATGSIGVSTLDVIARHPDLYRVHALTAYQRMDKLAEQAKVFRPAVVVVPDAAARERFLTAWGEAGKAPDVHVGDAALAEIAADPGSDTVMAAIVGAAGLPGALAAARAGKRVLLANKEALVVAGGLFMDAIRDNGAELLPIDSEHNAIFQCLPHHGRAGAPTSPEKSVRKLILTASGGPFRNRTLQELRDVTPAQACAHPNWSMGRKISVDSATMLNKGLEVIEAHWLFAMPPERIKVLVHPQSMIHSMVEYDDGSVLAQLGNPDMRTPIAYGLAFPDRIDAGVGSLDLARIGRLDFEEPDLPRFPCLRLAFEALAAGQTACIALNAANEVAVEAFLCDKLAYMDIANVIESVLNGRAAAASHVDLNTLDGLLAFDADVRRWTQDELVRLSPVHP
ncbi:1-deoxy-D-xylulose-5-phosphate reductoisomerase [Pigmentiphaga litoralis]|uniref:1-deoxy-D-xylulose 5-phosphate reductoisomerase n=1 Tax=Pigmentiphaga litoralis TaxID=516702 RepID=A0A7Y9LLU9_9BURK|nr:1-deoxy-D-xylulose-5-phosphate reductoisomerase [Pigmentiphaga litoralis]NYE22056.1 1-deoxy-D-xylulose-5-phosphate reductoisomerase [Pigmentiphaga litoralis]NYE84329.1 1-deoxy-D-xylulose-5-phosphate reductoisomerase [Pigmentiphaga litoralis]